jgi:hypothetical protein
MAGAAAPIAGAAASVAPAHTSTLEMTPGVSEPMRGAPIPPAHTSTVEMTVPSPLASSLKPGIRSPLAAAPPGAVPPAIAGGPPPSAPSSSDAYRPTQPAPIRPSDPGRAPILPGTQSGPLRDSGASVTDVTTKDKPRGPGLVVALLVMLVLAVAASAGVIWLRRPTR